MKDGDRTSLISLYSILFTKLNQEGDGIWSRANMLFVWQGGLTSVYVYTLSHKSDFAAGYFFVLLGTSIIGALLSVWSLVVMNRLWGWHHHWITQLKEIEATFPEQKGWPKPLSKGHDKAAIEDKATFNSHKPFFLALVMVWSVLGIYAVYLNSL